jgi:hypothetical protein
MKNIIVFLVFLHCSCSALKNGGAKNKIIGRWCSLSTQADYPHLTFRQDGYAFFDCKIDTIFGLKYILDRSQLIFISTDKPTYKSKILKLTEDSLILETLLEHNTKQVYYRCGEK